MGSGSDVAQNAADMILLDDNFSSIVNGVEEGRLIFDNLKKSIAYTLASNIPELTPFLCFVVFQIPIPLTTILILLIDLGTDMYPAIAFAYENPELDIMERMPRSAKRDRLVGAKLLSYSYVQVGYFETLAGFWVYFNVMNDYGFTPASLFGLGTEPGIKPNPTDVFNPHDVKWHGNTAAKALLGDLWPIHSTVRDRQSFINSKSPLYIPVDDLKAVDWFTSKEAHLDLRLYFFFRPIDHWSKCRWSTEMVHPKFYHTSWVTKTQICYTVEALHYAQGAFLIAIVAVQWDDLVITKTRALSLGQQGMTNWNANASLLFETILIIFISYLPWLNLVLGTRMVAFPHFMIPALSWFSIIFFYDEIRKFYVRRGMRKDPKANRTMYDGWLARNTYY